MSARTATALAWGAYLAFAIVVLYANRHVGLLVFEGSLGAVRGAVWVAWAAFLGYSIWCSRREVFVRSARRILDLHWGRQIGLDLYLGLGVGLLLIYLHGGPVALLVWAVPVLLFANLSVLLYLAIHFESIVAAFGA